MSFREAFPHHIKYVMCRAQGLFTATLGKKPHFRKYVRGYEPRAVFPSTEVQFCIALCIFELQNEERKVRYKNLHIQNRGGPCIGLQLDMWTDTNTRISYAGLNGTTVAEPEIVFTPPSTGSEDESEAVPLNKRPQLRLQSEVIDFDVFPHTKHTGVNICDWMENTTKKHEISFACVSGVSPDGAADGQCGLGKIEKLKEKVDTCHLHSLQSCVLWSNGSNGTTSTCKNPEMKGHLKQHNRCAQAHNQIREVAYGIHSGAAD